MSRAHTELTRGKASKSALKYVYARLLGAGDSSKLVFVGIINE